MQTAELAQLPPVTPLLLRLYEENKSVKTIQKINLQMVLTVCMERRINLFAMELKNVSGLIPWVNGLSGQQET